MCPNQIIKISVIDLYLRSNRNRKPTRINLPAGVNNHKTKGNRGMYKNTALSFPYPKGYITKLSYKLGSRKNLVIGLLGMGQDK
jgi:hypothetical protein